MTLKDMFEVRDALVTLIKHGYQLQDMLDAINKDIEVEVSRGWTQHQA